MYQATKQLLQDHAAYTAMAHAENPYGDGKASQRIKEVLAQYYPSVRNGKSFDPMIQKLKMELKNNKSIFT